MGIKPIKDNSNPGNFKKNESNHINSKNSFPVFFNNELNNLAGGIYKNSSNTRIHGVPISKNKAEEVNNEVNKLILKFVSSVKHNNKL